METLAMNEDQAIAALRHFHWNNEKLQEKWFDNETQVRIDIGILFDKKKFQSLDQLQKMEMSASLKENHGGMCIVCYSELSNKGDEEVISLDCKHEFCKGCWRDYLKEIVLNDTKKSLKAPCQQSGCNLVVPHSLFLKIFGEKE